jgi:signal transduction histidine kinase
LPLPDDLLSSLKMSLRQQQAAVFVGTLTLVFGIFAAGLWLIAQRLTTEATLQTALLMARQVEIALADSLRERPLTPPNAVRPQPSSSSFWSFLGKIFPGNRPTQMPPRPPSRQNEVRGLIRAFINRSGSIESMSVLNAEGKTLYSSKGNETAEPAIDPPMRDSLRNGIPLINTKHEGNARYYDVLVPLEMPRGVRGPGGLRLLINAASFTDLLSGMSRQLALLFALGGGVAVLSAFLTTTLYTRRFRLISDTLSQAEAGTYQARPQYLSRDEVGKSLDLIDRLVMKQRGGATAPAPGQRLAIAARTLAHEVRTPLNALAIHLEVLRGAASGGPPVDDSNGAKQQRSLAALDASVRQVDRLVRDFTDYSAPVTMELEPLDVFAVLAASLDDIASECAARKIKLTKNIAIGPWPARGDAARLRQTFDNLIRNAMEAQPEGGLIEVAAQRIGNRLTVEFRDAGPGVPPERRVEIFEYGKTTKAGGSGIGLPLSQLIAEFHGGSLTYVDRGGSRPGATFRVTLPLVEANESWRAPE